MRENGKHAIELQPQIHAAQGKQQLGKGAPFQSRGDLLLARSLSPLTLLVGNQSCPGEQGSGQRSFGLGSYQQSNPTLQGPPESVVVGISSCFIALVTCFP